MIDFPASPTVGQQFTAAGVTWVWDGTKWAASGLSVAYLPLAGGNMSGPIVLAADPAANLQAATKQYVDGVRYGDNRIINGDMRIDQRGVASGAGGTASGYTVDRWAYYGAQASKGSWGRGAAGAGLTALGFGYYLIFTSSSAYTPLASDAFQFNQAIEADAITDFAWGTAGAQPVTLSFLAVSTLTGTFGGSIQNYAGTRSYPFTFSIPAANTWTKIAVTIPGDTAGTWVLSGNGGGAFVIFDLGSGASKRGPAGAWASAGYAGANGAVNVVATNGANFQVTAVKLEIGSVATPYNRQSLAKSLADCQRYYSAVDAWMYATCNASTSFGQTITLPVSMRAAPTIAFTNVTYANASGITYGNASSVAPGVYANATAAGAANFKAIMTASAEL